jgi:intraflagellar transport protein 140
MLDAARYFESKGQLEKAVQLYHRGGAIGRSIDLCFRAELFDYLASIADELGERTDPQVEPRCNHFRSRLTRCGAAVAAPLRRLLYYPRTV